jgi:ADP-ribosyl-[dinitrogen reductase] hydrolase
MACGDALGRPVEFESPGTIRSRHGRVTEMLAEGTHRQPAGTITDDTELGLCIARSLVEHEAFVPAAVADRFVGWYSSDPFDIGRLTASALRRLDAGGSWETVGIEDWKHLPEGQNAGNGSVMRCAPYGVAFAADESALVTASRVSSALTHADPVSVELCRPQRHHRRPASGRRATARGRHRRRRSSSGIGTRGGPLRRVRPVGGGRSRQP